MAVLLSHAAQISMLVRLELRFHWIPPPRSVSGTRSCGILQEVGGTDTRPSSCEGHMKLSMKIELSVKKCDRTGLAPVAWQEPTQNKLSAVPAFNALSSRFSSTSRSPDHFILI